MLGESLFELGSESFKLEMELKMTHNIHCHFVTCLTLKTPIVINLKFLLRQPHQKYNRTVWRTYSSFP